MDDAAATRACRAGNVEAFRHFVDRYQARALAHARLLTRNEADAADATQEAFVDAFRNLGKFDATREFYAWFYALLRNRCFKQRTRAGTRAESGTAVPQGTAPGVSQVAIFAIVIAFRALKPVPEPALERRRGWARAAIGLAVAHVALVVTIILLNLDRLSKVVDALRAMSDLR